MKKYFFLATALVALASCSSDEMIGDYTSDSGPSKTESGIITFSSSRQAITRGDVYGSAAATLLGDNFYVTGTKGTEAATSPTPTLVFDNYLVHHSANTADQTQSNTANWEYVGVTPGSAPTANYVKLSTTAKAQTIKYWDYSAAQYDFLAFSTGSYAAVSGSSTASTNIGVTAMKYGTDLASSGVAYTFDIPSVDALKNTYITDITEVPAADYGKEVTLKFKNIGSKIRVALYETVPGYSVKDVKFYTTDATDLSGTSTPTASLISASALPTSGTINVFFPHVGSNNASATDYNKASATVTAGSTTSTSQTFGSLTNFASKEKYEADGSYLGRSLDKATFAGIEADKYYTSVFPVSTSNALTLRVDYTLVSTDGSEETINVKGARAVVPATYTKWLPNYAYTYIFKITDNTNGWTGTASQPAGLFPITFDAVVAEATDVNAEQKTITTVAAPTITTYQQGHDITKDEYAAGDIYVQVMDNSTTTATLKSDLDTKGAVYTVATTNPKDKDGIASESEIMDALNLVSLDATPVPLNGWALTSISTGTTYPTTIPGVDGNNITVTAKTAAKFTASASTTYAYVYEVSDADDSPIALAETLSSAPSDWPTNYYTDASCSTAASGTFAAGVYYHKIGVNKNKVLAVKIIKVQ